MFEENTPLLCKDCKYCKPSPVDRIESIFSFLPTKPGNFQKCTKFPQELPDRHDDLVSGHVSTKIEYHYCSTSRGHYGSCGPEGKFWSPRHKKDLFKLITKD